MKITSPSPAQRAKSLKISAFSSSLQHRFDNRHLYQIVRPGVKNNPEQATGLFSKEMRSGLDTPAEKGHVSPDEE